MSYISDNLMTGEKIVYQTRLHKIVFLWPAVFVTFCFIFIVTSTVIMHFIIWLVLGAVVAGFAYLKFTNSEFGVTNKRVLVKVGVLSTRSLEILLSKVEGIAVNQDILGKHFDFGTIVINGTGGTREPFKNIAQPFAFRKYVQEEIALGQTK
jgi:uncharacterized membrane protein YdbT with pleckstrin-like domain